MLRSVLRSIATVALGWMLGVSGQAHAGPITVPSGLNPGDQYRLAFVTSTFRNGASSSIGDYNSFVTGVANGVAELSALGTTWMAIASTSSVDARDNTSTNPNVDAGVPIYLLNDTLLANDNGDLWDGSIANALSINESGVVLPIGSALSVFTGTGSTGVRNTALGSASPTFGSSSSPLSIWISNAVVPAQTQLHIYGISGVLTVVPEPGTFALLGLGLMAMAVLRRASL